MIVHFYSQNLAESCRGVRRFHGDIEIHIHIYTHIMYIYIYVLADVNVFIVYMVLRCFVSVGSQAKKQARAAEAARREEERTAVKRAKEEATRAT